MLTLELHFVVSVTCLTPHLLLSNKSFSLQTAGHLPRPEDGQGDGSLPRLRACRPGSQLLHREVSPTRLGAGQNQRHHVADPLWRGLPPQSQDRPQGFKTSEHPGVPGGTGQAGRLWSGEDLRLQLIINHRGQYTQLVPDW